MIFTEADHARLASLFGGTLGSIGSGPYAGYKPEVVEAPNGDTKRCEVCKGYGDSYGNGPGGCLICRGSGRVPNVDAASACGCCGGQGGDGGCYMGRWEWPCEACNGTGRTPGKRYLHVAEKYLAQHPGLEWPREYLARAYYEACRVAEALQVPKAYWPVPVAGALRVLEYPPGAGTVEHTDFDLFSIVCWRSTPDDLEMTGPARITAQGRLDECADPLMIGARRIDPGLHIGEIGELVGLGPATPHRVPARNYAQRSIVYFALPDHGARLPSPPGAGLFNPPRYAPTVGEWLAERMKRSRYEASK